MLTKSTTIYQVKENRNWILIRLLLFFFLILELWWADKKKKKTNEVNEWIYTNIGKNKTMKSPFRFGCAVFVWLHSNYVRIRRFLITFGSTIFILLHISAWTIHLYVFPFFLFIMRSPKFGMWSGALWSNPFQSPSTHFSYSRV